MLGVECGVSECRPEDSFDQILREPATTAMADGNFGSMRLRDGTGERNGIGSGRDHVDLAASMAKIRRDGCALVAEFGAAFAKLYADSTSDQSIKGSGNTPNTRKVN